jgi:isoleucyl-tRNA synthetase
VGNPWLDAGVVPFSTLGISRRTLSAGKNGIQQHWISESFPGQFRNWFYSLLAMGTVIDQSPPFLQNFGYATLVAEDGRPMHKSWGNSIEFNEAADRMGVDVMRWLYCNHKPENDLQFGYNRGDEARRQFLIPLWNAIQFLRDLRQPGWLEAGQEVLILTHSFPKVRDSAILTICWTGGCLPALNQVAQRVTDELEDSDFQGAAGAVAVFIDDLTNWYVRRSRRRFWKSEHDSDKGSAYATLYHVLVKLSRMLAPFTPFFTESIYQNLVRSVCISSSPGEYPPYSLAKSRFSEAVDARLCWKKWRLSRQVASLGLGSSKQRQYQGAPAPGKGRWYMRAANAA